VSEAAAYHFDDGAAAFVYQHQVVADLKASHWDRGSFVRCCTVCDRAMINLPGLTWQLRVTGGLRHGRTMPSTIKVLTVSLATFLVALPAMILLYKWLT
jgi:hypothetical protein